MSGYIDTIKRKIKNVVSTVKNALSVDKKGFVAGAVLSILLVIFMKVLPKDFGFNGSRVLYLLALDVILLLMLGVKVELPERLKEYLAFGSIILAPAVSLFFVEYISQNFIKNMKFQVVFMNYVCGLIFYILLYVIFNRISIAVPAGLIIWIIYAMANRFVDVFRGYGIKAYDIYGLKTAANVASGYELIFDKNMVKGMLIVIACAALSVMVRWKTKKKKHRLVVGISVLAAALLFNVTFLNKQYLEKYELNPYLWSTRASARDHGSMLELVTGAKYMMLEKPEGYSKKEAILPQEKATGSVVQKVVNKKPHIIAIMNESFSDLSAVGGDNLVTSGEDYLEYYHSMSGNVIKGLTQVPVFGAQTAKSEFEFLTGYSNSFLPEGVMPFQAYVKNGEYNLGAVLEEQGYDTAFMHLFWKNGWNRVNVYNSFGFDETYFLDEVDEIGGVEDSDYIRGVVSDKAGYEKLIDRYEKQKGKDRPLFLFQVTIQNHGGYDKGGIDKVVKVEKPAGDYPKTEEYLACINESDNALEELITYFEKEEEPVIICMFGDHLPTVEQTFRDAMGVGTTEEENSKWYQTPYFIWSNYELNTELDEEVISVNYLSGVLMEAAGLPLDPYHEYLQGMMKKYPVISVYGVKDKDGKWYSWNNALQFEDIREYQKLQYYHLFDS